MAEDFPLSVPCQDQYMHDKKVSVSVRAFLLSSSAIDYSVRSLIFSMASEILTSFLGALQASLSVLLVIFYGVLAAQFDILKGDSTKQISTLCVRMFLPALLITKVGSQLHADTGIRYVPILSKITACTTVAWNQIC